MQFKNHLKKIILRQADLHYNCTTVLTRRTSAGNYLVLYFLDKKHNIFDEKCVVETFF